MFNDAETWVVNRFTEGIPPPFSFKYADRPSKCFLKDWQFSHKMSQLDDARNSLTV